MGKLEKYLSYKDSKVDWIGEIPKHWTITKLKYLGTSTIGLTYNPNNLCNKEEGTLVLRSSNIQNGKLTFDDNVYVKSNIPKKLFIKENDILICSRNGSRELIGKCAIAKKEDEKYSFGAFTTVFRSKLNSYLFQILNSEIFKKQSGKFLTSTINQLTVGNLNSFEIPLPPKEEQTKIASFLNEKTAQIDEVISQKQKLIELLKERKQIVVNDAVTKGLDKNVEMIDSGVEWIGEIPKHWKLERLGSNFIERREKVSDKDFEPLSVTKNGVVPQLDSAAKSNDGDNRKLVRKGDFVINSRSDRKGSSGLSILDGSVSLIYIVLKPININSDFSHILLKSNGFIEEFYRNGHGIVADLWTTRFWDMKSIMLAIPPKDEQFQIVEHIENQTKKIDIAIELQQNYISKLKEYKASLIDSVVTGKVRVV